MTTKIYNMAQSFFVDPNTVKGAPRIGISAIDLYFNQKPTATGNKSGINNPGVSMYICEVNADKHPIISDITSGKYKNFARANYTDIAVSDDASRATTLRFGTPLEVDTNKEYAFVLQFDGNENFVLWKNKQNDLLIGSNTISSGATGKFFGYFYDTYSLDSAANTVPTWNFSSGVDLKFKVYAARYSQNGTPVSAQTVPATVPIYGPDGSKYVNLTYTSNGAIFKISPNSYEYISFNGKYSNYANVLIGEKVYQNTVFWPGGSANGVTVSVTANGFTVTANANLPNGAAFNWNNVFVQNDPEYIVVVSNNHGGAGTKKTNIRRVLSVESNTQIIVDKPFDFSNSAAYFIKSPVAQISWFDNAKLNPPGANGSIGPKLVQNMLTLYDTNANTTHRFVNNQISAVAVTANGTGYSNTDYIKIFGYEDNAFVKGGYPAVGNIVTSNTGTINAIYLSNVGAGFINVANINVVISTNSVSNAAVLYNTANTSLGNSATFTVVAETTILSEFYLSNNVGGGLFSNINVLTLPLHQIKPSVNINNITAIDYNMTYQNSYYLKTNPITFSGISHHYDDTRPSYVVSNTTFTHLKNQYVCVVPSKSNEHSIVNILTGNLSNTPPPGSGTLNIYGASASDFICLKPSDVVLSFKHYLINNTYANENTNYGLADAKHVTKKVTFNNGKFAEDLLVYLTAYRPAGTDLKVFARIQNSSDGDAFDDKDWTMMGLVDGNIYSSTSNETDYIDMTFGFNQYPNSVFTYSGTVAIADIANTIVTGSGTSFSTNATANIQINDLVKIYSPLFPLDHYWLSVVNSISSDASFTITDPIPNTSIIGTGLKIDLIGRLGNSTVNAIGYPLQAFNNSPNENVARYFSTNMNPFDTFDSFQVKVVLLSNSSIADSNQIIPRVDDIRATGVSA